jgi:hypothetical protein
VLQNALPTPAPMGADRLCPRSLASRRQHPPQPSGRPRATARAPRFARRSTPPAAAMPTVRLGGSDLEVPRICFGAAPRSRRAAAAAVAERTHRRPRLAAPPGPSPNPGPRPPSRPPHRRHDAVRRVDRAGGRGAAAGRLPRRRRQLFRRRRDVPRAPAGGDVRPVRGDPGRVDAAAAEVGAARGCGRGPGMAWDAHSRAHMRMHTSVHTQTSAHTQHTNTRAVSRRPRHRPCTHPPPAARPPSPAARDSVIVATKAAGPSGQMAWIRGGPHRLDAANIAAALDGSLRRLGTDYVDLYQLHWPDRCGRPAKPPQLSFRFLRSLDPWAWQRAVQASTSGSPTEAAPSHLGAHMLPTPAHPSQPRKPPNPKQTPKQTPKSLQVRPHVWRRRLRPLLRLPGGGRGGWGWGGWGGPGGFGEGRGG